MDNISKPVIARTLALILVSCLPHISEAAIVPSPQGKITEIVTFADYGGGDVVVKMDTNTAQCPAGFWFEPNQPGFSALLSGLLAAKHAGTDVVINGLDNEIWGGSSGTFCKVYSVVHK